MKVQTKVGRSRPAALLAGLVAQALPVGCEGPPTFVDAGGEQVRDAATDVPEASLPRPIHDVDWRLHEDIESIVIVGWEQEISATSLVRYRVDDEPWQQTPPQDRAPGRQEQMVLGLPYDSAFELRVVATAAGAEHLGDLVAGTSGASPRTIDVPEVVLSDETAFEPTGRYLFGSVTVDEGRFSTDGGFWSYIVDRRGRLVWAKQTPRLHSAVYSRVSVDGRDLLVDENPYWLNFDASESRVHRMKIDGSIVQTYDTPGMRHPFTELPDGTIVWGSTLPPREETLEELTPDGSQRTIWDSEVFLAAQGPEFADRRFQSNALSWDQETETFLFSSFLGSYVLQIARDGSVSRILGGDLPEAWRFSPEEAAFSWQHGVAFTDDRTLLLSMHDSDPDSGTEGIVREYALDDEAKTLRQVWSWGRGNGIETVYAGDAQRLANGDTLINYGTSPVIREVTRDGTIVWEIRWTVPHFIGRSVLLEDLYEFVP